MRDRGAPRGLLVAVVGPSGAGKDTLLRLAFGGLGNRSDMRLARRVITRQADGETEDHDSLDAESFSRAEAAGAFCLAWRAHGLAYALPRSVEDGLRDGQIVVANLSRRVLAETARRFGRLALVEITAPPAVLVTRIAARGRETPREIEARLSRQIRWEVPDGACSVLSIDNGGPASDGADRLRRHLLSLAERMGKPDSP